MPTSVPSSDPTSLPTLHPTLPLTCVDGCHSCDSSCWSCDSVFDNGDGTLDVTVSHCKCGSLSWMCCVGVDGQQGNCEVLSCPFGDLDGRKDSKCSTIPQGSGLTIRIPSSSTSFEINTHDGQTAGLGDNIGEVCGGNKNQGGGCKSNGFSAHCNLFFELAGSKNAFGCGYQPASDLKTADDDRKVSFDSPATSSGSSSIFHPDCDQPIHASRTGTTSDGKRALRGKLDSPIMEIDSLLPA